MASSVTSLVEFVHVLFSEVVAGTLITPIVFSLRPCSNRLVVCISKRTGPAVVASVYEKQRENIALILVMCVYKRKNGKVSGDGKGSFTV